MKVVFYWILAVLITFSAIIYQRKTGPTYDKKVKVIIDNQEYKFKLIRSHGGETDCKIELLIPDRNVDGVLAFKKYPTKDNWTNVTDNKTLLAFIFWLLAFFMNRKKE